MRIGIPKEIKSKEGRVSLTPMACKRLVEAGHHVFIEQTAGDASGYSDFDYRAMGVEIVSGAKQLYAAATLIVKVKEPILGDLPYLTHQHILFSYLHLAAEPVLLKALQKIGLTAVAFETVEQPDGSLPLLAPMSAIAGRIAGQVGTHLLHTSQGGKGLLLGGLSNTDRGQVVVLGAGVAGTQAIDVVANMGANVTVFDVDEQKLSLLNAQYDHIQAIKSSASAIEMAVKKADLLIGAVLIAGSKAPILVSESLVKQMQAGSVIIDIAVDQGGCIETIHPTDYRSPTYFTHHVLHFGVTNMPGAVPQTATQALSSALLPYVLLLADHQLLKDQTLKRGINLMNGEVIHSALLSNEY